ncbi:MAG: RNA polymerase sigma factor, partial [Nitrosomonas sp.]|nr:RNA polymerase sigma factor [Nitrosomonas sp.]
MLPSPALTVRKARLVAKAKSAVPDCFCTFDTEISYARRVARVIPILIRFSSVLRHFVAFHPYGKHSIIMLFLAHYALLSMTTSCTNDELFLQLRNDLLNFLYRKVGRDEAADMVQEVYLRWRKQDVSSIENPRAFLFTVALNLIRDSSRQQIRVDKHTTEIQNFFEIGNAADDPARRYDGQRQLASLLHALNQLPEPVGHAFLLFRYDGMTHAQIAKQLGVSSKTVERYIQ